MALTGTSRIHTSTIGDGSNVIYDSPVKSNVAAAGRFTYTLATGNNTITNPGTQTRATLIPPVSNVTGWTLKGVAGDTGIALALSEPTVLSMISATGFVLNNSGASFTIWIDWC